MPSSSTASVFVFGYGSLVAHADPEEGPLALLAGARRAWGVAMDNTEAIPGYKRYRHPRTREAPACFVTFLDLVVAADGAPGVNGALVPVDAGELALLDERERNYRRIDVTARIRPRRSGVRVVAYVGSAEGRGRAARGRREGTAVVHAGYRRLVEEAFAMHGAAADERYRATTMAAGLPARDLERVAVPPVVAA